MNVPFGRWWWANEPGAMAGDAGRAVVGAGCRRVAGAGMTRREYREAGCDGKEGLSQRRAVEIAKAMKRRGRRGVEQYKCNFCGSWHVGGSAVHK